MNIRKVKIEVPLPWSEQPLRVDIEGLGAIALVGAAALLGFLIWRLAPLAPA